MTKKLEDPQKTRVKLETPSFSQVKLRPIRKPPLISLHRRNSETIVSQMDWQGQKVAEQLMQILLLVSAVVAFVTGCVMGSFQNMILIYAAGVVLTALIVVPNWPFFNRHPLNWLDPSEADRHPKPQVTSTPKKKSNKQK